MNIDEIIQSAAKELSVNRCACEALRSADSCVLPNREMIIQVLTDLKKAIFPGYFDGETLTDASAEYYEGYLLTEIYRKLKPQIEIALRLPVSNTDPDEAESRAQAVCAKLISELPEIRRLLMCDVEAGFHGDPAAKSRAEIIVSYPGLLAIFVYRIAHILYKEDIPLIPRIMTEYAHGKTGIDINSGAEIGEYFFIDHGTGVVIGETTVIGNHVKLYQGVTLGALSTRSGQELSGVKRHPTIRDNVTIYANSTVLGGETVIGNGVIIGGNAFITKSIPDYTKIIVKSPEMIFKNPRISAGKWEI
ncbi:MAG: serine acetyltransferase [Clostridia bacterium]|nr:serine acetyltransferase [Clostridia bacterium]